MVMGTVRQRIAGRSLTPGAKLPSIRALSGSLKVSASTVVDAYERLVAEGVILSRPGSGFGEHDLVGRGLDAAIGHAACNQLA